jgi:hypothetical protein
MLKYRGYRPIAVFYLCLLGFFLLLGVHFVLPTFTYIELTGAATSSLETIDATLVAIFGVAFCFTPGPVLEVSVEPGGLRATRRSFFQRRSVLYPWGSLSTTDAHVRGGSAVVISSRSPWPPHAIRLVVEPELILQPYTNSVP